MDRKLLLKNLPVKDKPAIKYIDKTLVLSPCYIGFCTTEKAFNKELKRLNVKGEWPSFLGKYGHATTHFIERGKDVTCIVCLDSTKRRTKVQVHALLVHEAVHVWQQIKKTMGESNPSEEFEAYALQNICQSLFELYEADRRHS